MRSVHLSLALALSAGPLVAPASAEAEMIRIDGDLGGSVTFQFQGDPFQLWGWAFSFNEGPTPLVLFDPLESRILEVGFDLIQLWQLGALDGAGQGSLTVPLPPQVTLVGLPFYSQMVTIPGAPTLVDEISEQNTFLLSFPSSTVQTLPVMPEDLDLHTASELPGGKVLIAGGTVDTGPITFVAVDNYWVYDGQTSELTQLATTMTEPRTQHTATTLADGRILTLGGTDEFGATRKTGEIFDPATMTAAPITPMSIERVLHTATLLDDGRVFVAGGASLVDVANPLSLISNVLQTTEIYDPATDTWTPGPNMPEPRVLHAATRLGDGRILLTGGIEIVSVLFIDVPEISNTALRYDAGTDSFLPTASFSGPRGVHGQIALPNGDAAMIGGVDGDLILQLFSCRSDCAIYNHAANTWTSVGSMAVPRAFPALEIFNDELYAMGGASTFGITTLGGDPVFEIERAPLSILSWNTVTSTVLPREQARTAIFDNGSRILISGFGDNGTGGGTPDFTAEVFLP